MPKQPLASRVLGAGIVTGALLFFLCYWWLGSISFSAAVALAVAALVVLAGRATARLRPPG